MLKHLRAYRNRYIDIGEKYYYLCPKLLKGFMVWLYMFLVVAASTILWMVSRWAMQDDGDSKVQGFWIALVGTFLLGIILYVQNISILNYPIIVSGFITAISASIGFLWIMMYCLKIGPAGLTLTINNAAMVFGILFSFIILDPHFPGLISIAGILFTLIGLIMIGISNSSDDIHKGFSKRWLKLVMIGGGLSGVSYCNQTYIGTCHPGISSLLVFIFWVNIFSVSILSIIAGYFKLKLFRRREMIGGFVIGVLTNVALFFTIFSMKFLGSEIVLPVSIASPMVIMLLIGHFIYHEHLRPLSWLGAGITIISLVLLSLKF
jgi:drug/metabolite transporter (DMT)-like permease